MSGVSVESEGTDDAPSMAHPADNGRTSGESWPEALDGFAAHLRAAGARPGTVALRLRYLERLRSTTSSGPWSLTHDELTRFLANPRWAPETRRVALSSLRGFHRWGHITGRRQDDPAATLPPVRVPAGRPRPAPEAVLQEALRRATTRSRAMVMLAAYAGLRRAEIASLNVADVLDGELRITGKGGKVRAVPLHPTLAEALAPLLEAAPKSGYLFPGRDDGHLSPKNVGRTVSALLPGSWTTHTLRHRFATAAYESVSDLRSLQEVLGHSKPETTARYTAVSPEALRRIVMAAGPAASEPSGDEP